MIASPYTFIVVLALAALALEGCGGKLPDTRFYDLAPPQTVAPVGTATLVIEPLTTDAAYDDERIVYRTTPYRLDYYQYHRWSAAPGTLIGNYLETAFERSGQFRSVLRDSSSKANVALRGRVVAIEEIDDSKAAWHGHLVLELTLVDSVSGETLWTDQFEENEPLTKQSPEGLAKALSAAMARIADKAAPTIASFAQPKVTARK